MDLEPLPFQASLGPGDLGAYLDAIGPASPLSLRNEVTPAERLSADAASALQSAHLLTAQDGEPTEAGRSLGQVLLDPETLVSLEFWGVNTESARTTVAFPSRPAAGVGVVINRHDDRYDLAGFVDDVTLADLVEPLLPPAAVIDAPPFEAVLEPDQAAVLSALVDRLAAEYDAESRRRRDSTEASADVGFSAFTARAITDHLDIWWGNAPRHRLLTQVFALLLNPDPVPIERCWLVLEGFVSAGLLRRAEAGAYAPSASLEAIAKIMSQVTGGLCWDRIVRQVDGDLAGVIRRYLICESGLVFVVELAGETRLRIAAEGPDDLRRFLADEFAGAALTPVPTGRAGPPLDEPSEQPIQEQAAPSDAAMPSFEAPPAAGNAGAPQVIYCTQCGARLTPGDNFCEACGASTADG